MDDITVFNLRAVNKGALKATVSIRLGSGLTIHDSKITQQDGMLSAALPQRSERQKGEEVVYHDLVGSPGVNIGKFTLRGVHNILTGFDANVLHAKSVDCLMLTTHVFFSDYRQLPSAR
jgi:DNA-binding cell septation regulator SpoVG